MSNHLISIFHERLRHLYDETLGFELSDDSNVLFVQSASRPHLMHKVTLEGDAIRCTCETTEGLACRHRATAAAYYFPVRCWLAWATEDSAKFLDLRHRIRTGGKLTRSEKRRLTKSIREREAVEVAA